MGRLEQYYNLLIPIIAIKTKTHKNYLPDPERRSFFTVGNIAMTLMCHLNWCHSSNTWSVIHNCPNALKMAEKLMNFLQDPLSGN